MAASRLVIAGPAGHNLKRIPQPWRDRIEKAIDAIAVDPFRGRKLQSKIGKWRVRIWPYRIVYRIDKKRKVVEIVQVGHRGSIHY